MSSNARWRRIVGQRGNQSCWYLKSSAYLGDITTDSAHESGWVSSAAFVKLKFLTFQRSIGWIDCWSANYDNFWLFFSFTWAALISFVQMNCLITLTMILWFRTALFALLMLSFWLIWTAFWAFVLFMFRRRRRGEWEKRVLFSRLFLQSTQIHRNSGTDLSVIMNQGNIRFETFTLSQLVNPFQQKWSNFSTWYFLFISLL